MLGLLVAGAVVGLAVLLVQAVQQRPEGDFLVGSDLAGYGLLTLGLVVLVGAVVSVPRRRPTTAAAEDSTL